MDEFKGISELNGNWMKIIIWNLFEVSKEMKSEQYVRKWVISLLNKHQCIFRRDERNPIM